MVAINQEQTNMFSLVDMQPPLLPCLSTAQPSQGEVTFVLLQQLEEKEENHHHNEDHSTSKRWQLFSCHSIPTLPHHIYH
jgi:hypothetical protein